MKRLLRFWLVGLALLAGCGGGGVSVSDGGGGVGSGGTGAQANGAVSIGSIDGFGSIIVNGIRFDIATAEIRLSDVPELALGMTVAINGVVDASMASGTASVVTSSAELQGPVTAVDAAGRSLSLSGVAVSTDEVTAYAGVADLAGLNAGDEVRIHGLPAGSALRATRIERLTAGAAAILTGSVVDLDRGNRRFRLGERIVGYGGASLDAALGPQGPQEGQTVRVRARSGDAAAPGLVLEAGAIERWYTLDTTEGLRASVAGVVGNFEGPASFRVQGQRIDAAGATVRGGVLGEGARVEVTGAFRGEVLVAGLVQVSQTRRPDAGSGSGSGSGVPGGAAEPARFSAEGTVGQYRGPESFRVQGQAIDASGPGVVFTGGSVADLGPGRKLKVTGARVTGGVLLAETVTFERQAEQTR